MITRTDMISTPPQSLEDFAVSTMNWVCASYKDISYEENIGQMYVEASKQYARCAKMGVRPAKYWTARAFLSTYLRDKHKHDPANAKLCEEITPSYEMVVEETITILDKLPYKLRVMCELLAWFSVDEVAKILRIKPHTIYRQRKQAAAMLGIDMSGYVPKNWRGK